MSESIVQIDQYLDLMFAYGTLWVYLLILAACFVENLFPPFPGDSFIVAAGGLVATTRLHWLPTVLVVVCGGMASVMIIYLLGRRYGRDFFIRKNYRYFSAADIIKVENYFSKWGPLILISSRFVVGCRVILSLVAGVSSYPAARMFAYTAISYCLFCGVLMYIGYMLMENMDTVAYYFKTYRTILWPALAVLLVVYVFRRFQKFRGGQKA
ncbi:MAG: hypothetical protein DRP45_01800 [Candidatus Zixiibacteriota bacterium]|nr:MAG: hypothetical protein DRP45_01800 [candidate division Zixibacteria bacterium]